ncbi:hypothetical protein V5O48_003783 [Marasmius crinis-equi]|uniref:BTB domain-containing protein n=1 Tax=Marasmius crinis-equi TaxID=585013 RepID=A0ABR3FRX6_9AGAR
MENLVPPEDDAASQTGASPLNPEVASANWPFDDPEADIVIQTIDHVLFRVHRHYLDKVSPLLQIAFSPGENQSGATPNLLLMRSQSLDYILRTALITSGAGTEIALNPSAPRSFQFCAETLELMARLGLQDSVSFHILVEALLGVADTPKMSINAFAVMHKLRSSLSQKQINAAARSLLRWPNNSLISEFDTNSTYCKALTVREYVALLQYHAECSSAIRDHPAFRSLTPFSPRLQYVCLLAQKRVGNTVEVQICTLSAERSREVFNYMRHIAFANNPYECLRPIETPIIQRASQAQNIWACSGCLCVGCPSMLQALSRLYEAEVEEALNGVANLPLM